MGGWIDAAAWFASGRVVDVVLAVVLLEAVALVALRKLSARDAVSMLVPGVLLMLAVRAALVGAAWTWIAVALAAAGVAHALDVARRVRRAH